MRASAADFEDAGQCALFGFVTPQQKDDGGRQNASLLEAECGGPEKGAPALTGAVWQRSRRASPIPVPNTPRAANSTAKLPNMPWQRE